MISNVDTGIVISLSSSHGERELKEEGLCELEELEYCLLEQWDNTLEYGWWSAGSCVLGWILRDVGLIIVSCDFFFASCYGFLSS